MEKYNGWKNRETWATYLQLTNDEPSYRHIEELRKSSKTWQELSDKLKDHVYELRNNFLNNPTPKLASLFDDIGSLHRIDFDEIGRNVWQE